MTTLVRQEKSRQWHEQWSMFQDDERFLFEEWIAPLTLGDLRGKSVLEMGCGGGQHTSFMAEVAGSVTAIDLNTVDIARERTRRFTNVELIEGDIANVDLGRQFDVVCCIGVIHHTDDPDRTFDSLYRHCRPGGTIVVWTYSAEGNALVRYLVEPARKLLLNRLPRRLLVWVSGALTALLYPFVYTIYRLEPLRALPYFEYFKNFRRLSFGRNVLNVFDKLNAPQTRFTTGETCRRWLDPARFDAEATSIRRYAGVSWTLVGRKRKE